MISETAATFISKCFKGNRPMVIQPYLNTKYEINNKIYILTENILEEMIASGRVKVLSRSEKWINITGVGEND